MISARKGEFEAGFDKGGQVTGSATTTTTTATIPTSHLHSLQTREHAMLAKTLGVRILVVVINKMDDPSCGWAKERFDECVTKLTPFLKQCGYNVKKDVVFLPISVRAQFRAILAELCAILCAILRAILLTPHLHPSLVRRSPRKT